MPRWKIVLLWFSIAIVIIGGWLALIPVNADRWPLWLAGVLMVAAFTPVAVVLENQRRRGKP